MRASWRSCVRKRQTLMTGSQPRSILRQLVNPLGRPGLIQPGPVYFRAGLFFGFVSLRLVWVAEQGRGSCFSPVRHSSTLSRHQAEVRDSDSQFHTDGPLKGNVTMRISSRLKAPIAALLRRRIRVDLAQFLAATGDCRATQERVLASLLDLNRDSRFSQDHGLSSATGVADLRNCLPVTTYETPSWVAS